MSVDASTLSGRQCPLLSIAVVVHGEQGHLTRLLASILDQDRADDLEIVAIDDASPDHGPALLDDLAERDSRVRVHHLERRVGLSEGRNLARAIARGEYLWFVRSTGWLPPGSIAAIRRQLEKVRPDVLIVHQSHANVLRERHPGPRRKLLARIADEGAVSLVERPEIAALVPQDWNKVIRRELLDELGLRFSCGGHSELGVTWPALLVADRISATPAESYVREQPPNAVGDSFVKGSPFDVFDQYDHVLSFVDSRPDELGTLRPLVLRAMLRHQLYILEFVPEEERRAFFHRISESYRRHRGAERLATSERARLRELLVERDSYSTFHLIERASGLRPSSSGVLWAARRALWRFRHRVLRPPVPHGLQRHYRVRRREPIDPHLAVFAAYWYRGYACNPRAIFEKARELVPEMHGVWVVREEAVDGLPAGVDHVVAGTREYFELLAKAGYFVNNVNFPNHVVKRDGTTHVMTHHGTPLKRMGFDLRDTQGEERVNYAALLNRCRRWDFSISQNAFTTIAWERAFPAPYESLEVGYPRNDVLANPPEDAAGRIREELGIPSGRRVVLFAPTHREYQAGYVPTVDVAEVADGLGPEYTVMARLHYLYEADPELRDLHREGRILDVADHRSVEELCLVADVLVTDYSSIMFDFAVLDRPIVIHAPDWEEYRTRRGTLFDLIAAPPGIVTRTEREMIDAFHSGAVWGEDSGEMRASFRTRFCYLDDGRAAERVVRRVWLGEREAAAQAAAAL